MTAHTPITLRRRARALLCRLRGSHRFVLAAVTTLTSTGGTVTDHVPMCCDCLWQPPHLG